MGPAKSCIFGEKDDDDHDDEVDGDQDEDDDKDKDKCSSWVLRCLCLQIFWAVSCVWALAFLLGRATMGFMRHMS